MTKELSNPVEERKSKSLKENHLVLYNDDVNTFEFVIDSLMEVCKHTPEQAEQCTMIIHFNGKCTVKSGVKNKLIPLCSALCVRGLSAVIE